MSEAKSFVIRRGSPGRTPFAGGAPQFNWSSAEEIQDANSLSAHPDRRQLRLLALRDDSESKRIIAFMWRLLKHDSNDCVSMQDYSAFLRRVVRAMVPSISDPEVHAIALEDAVRDTQGEQGVLSYSQFFDALFELGTLWCASETPAAGDLRQFLLHLRGSIAGVQLPGKGEVLPFPASAADIALFMKTHGSSVLDMSPCLLPEAQVVCRPTISAWRVHGMASTSPNAAHVPVSPPEGHTSSAASGVVQLIASEPAASASSASVRPPGVHSPVKPRAQPVQGGTNTQSQAQSSQGLASRRQQAVSRLMLSSQERSDVASAGDRAVVTGAHQRSGSHGHGFADEVQSLAATLVLPMFAQSTDEDPESQDLKPVTHSPVRGIRSAMQGGGGGALTVASSPALHARPAAESAGLTEELHGTLQGSVDVSKESHETQQLLRAHRSLRSILMGTKAHRQGAAGDQQQHQEDTSAASGLSIRAPAETTPHGVPAVGASAAADASQSPSFQHRMARVNKSSAVNRRNMRRNTPMPGSMAAAARGAAAGAAARAGGPATNLASASLGIHQLAEGDEDTDELSGDDDDEDEGDEVPSLPSVGSQAPITKPAQPAIPESKSESDSEAENDPNVGGGIPFAGAQLPQASDVPVQPSCVKHLAKKGLHSSLAVGVPEHMNNKSSMCCSVLPADVLAVLIKAAGLHTQSGHASAALAQGAVQLQSGIVVSATQVQRKPLPAAGHVTFVDRIRATKAALPEGTDELSAQTRKAVYAALIDPMYRIVFHVEDPASGKPSKAETVSLSVGHNQALVSIATYAASSYEACHALCQLARGAGKEQLVQDMHSAAETAATARVRSATGDNMQHSRVLHCSSTDRDERTPEVRKEEPVRDFIKENADSSSPEDDLFAPLQAGVRPGIAGDMRKVPPRVVVTGPAGSGRTTAAKKLALALGVRYIEPSVLIAEAVAYPAGWSAPEVARQNLKQSEVSAVALCEENDTPTLNKRATQATAVRGDVSLPQLSAVQDQREKHTGVTAAQLSSTSASASTPPQSNSSTTTSVIPMPYASELDSLPVDEGVAEWWAGVQGAEAKTGAKHIKSIEARAKKLSRAKAKASRSADDEEGFDLFDIEGEIADDEAQWTRELQVRHRIGALSAQLAAKRPLYSAVEDPRSVLGQLADAHLRRGDVVPGTIVLALVRDAMLEAVDAGTGYVLDGYPNTVEEYQALKTALGTGIVRGVQLYDWAQEVKAGVTAHRHMRARKVARDATRDALDVLVNILGPSPRFGMDPVALGEEPAEGLGIDMTPALPSSTAEEGDADPMGGQLPHIAHGINATAALSSEERSAALAAAADALATTPAGRPDSRSSSRGGKSVTISERANKTKHFYKALPSATASRSGRRPPLGMALGDTSDGSSAVGVLDVLRGAGKRPWESVQSDCSLDGGHAFCLPSASQVYVGPQIAVLRAVKDVLPLQVVSLALPEAEAVAARGLVLTDPLSGQRYSAADQASKLACPAYDESRLDSGAGEAEPQAPGLNAATYLDIFAPGDADVEDTPRAIALAELQTEKGTVDELLRSVVNAMLAHTADGDSLPPGGVAMPNTDDLEPEDAQRLNRFTKQRVNAGHAAVLSCDAPTDPASGEVMAEVHPDGVRALGAGYAALQQLPTGDSEVTVGLVLQWMRSALEDVKRSAQASVQAAQEAGAEPPVQPPTAQGGAAAGSQASGSDAGDSDGDDDDDGEGKGNEDDAAEPSQPSLLEWLGLPEGFLEEEATVEDLEAALPESTMRTLTNIASELNHLLASSSSLYLHGATFSSAAFQPRKVLPATAAQQAFEAGQVALAKRGAPAHDEQEEADDVMDEAEVEAAAPSETSSTLLAALNGTAGGETLARVRGLLRRLYLGMRARQLAKAEREMPRLGFKAFRPHGAVRSGVAALYVRAPAGLTVGGMGSRAYGLAANPLLLHMLGGLPAEDDKPLPGSFHTGLEDPDSAPEEDIESGYAMFRAASLAAAAGIQRSRLDALLARTLFKAFAEVIPFEAAAQVGALRRPGAAMTAMLSGAAVPLGSVIDEDEQVLPEQLPAVLVQRPEDAAENVRWDCLEWAREEGPLLDALGGVAKTVTRIDATQTPAEVFVQSLLGLCEGVLPAYSRLGVPPPRPVPLRLPAELAPPAMPTLEEAEDAAAAEGASEVGEALPVRSAAETLAGEDLGHVASSLWGARAQWEALSDGVAPAAPADRSGSAAGIALGKRDVHSAQSQGSNKEDMRAIVPGSDMLPLFFGHQQPGRDTLPMNTPDNEAMAFLLYGAAPPRRFDRETEAALDGRFLHAPSSSVHPDVLATVGGTWSGRYTPEWVPTGNAEGYDLALQDRANWAVWLSRLGLSVALRREIDALTWWADAQLMQRALAPALADESKRDKWYLKKAAAAEKAAAKSKSSSKSASRKKAAAAADNDPELLERLLSEAKQAAQALQQPPMPRAEQLLPQLVKFIASLRQRALVSSLAAAAEAVVSSIPRVASTSLLAVLPGTGANLDSASDGTGSAAGTTPLPADSGHPLSFFLSAPTDPSAVTLVAGLGGASGDEDALDEKEASANEDLDVVRRVAGARAFGILGVGLPDDDEVGDEPDEEVETAALLTRFQWWGAAVASAVDGLALEEMRDDDAVAEDLAQVLDAESEAEWYEGTDAAERMLAAAGESVPLQLPSVHKHGNKAPQRSSENDAVAHRWWVRAARARARGWRARARDQHRRLSPFGLACPVAYAADGHIKQGLPQFAAHYKGFLFVFSSGAAKACFLRSPAQYLTARPVMPASSAKVAIGGAHLSGVEHAADALCSELGLKPLDVVSILRRRLQAVSQNGGVLVAPIMDATAPGSNASPSEISGVSEREDLSPRSKARKQRKALPEALQVLPEVPASLSHRAAWLLAQGKALPAPLLAALLVDELERMCETPLPQPSSSAAASSSDADSADLTVDRLLAAMEAAVLDVRTSRLTEETKLRRKALTKAKAGKAGYSDSEVSKAQRRADEEERWFNKQVEIAERQLEEEEEHMTSEGWTAPAGFSLPANGWCLSGVPTVPAVWRALLRRGVVPDTVVLLDVTSHSRPAVHAARRVASGSARAAQGLGLDEQLVLHQGAFLEAEEAAAGEEPRVLVAQAIQLAEQCGTVSQSLVDTLVAGGDVASAVAALGMGGEDAPDSEEPTADTEELWSAEAAHRYRAALRSSLPLEEQCALPSAAALQEFQGSLVQVANLLRRHRVQVVVVPAGAGYSDSDVQSMARAAVDPFVNILEPQAWWNDVWSGAMDWMVSGANVGATGAGEDSVDADDNAGTVLALGPYGRYCAVTAVAGGMLLPVQDISPGDLADSEHSTFASTLALSRKGGIGSNVARIAGNTWLFSDARNRRFFDMHSGALSRLGERQSGTLLAPPKVHFPIIMPIVPSGAHVDAELAAVAAQFTPSLHMLSVLTHVLSLWKWSPAQAHGMDEETAQELQTVWYNRRRVLRAALREVWGGAEAWLTWLRSAPQFAGLLSDREKFEEGLVDWEGHSTQLPFEYDIPSLFKPDGVDTAAVDKAVRIAQLQAAGEEPEEEDDTRDEEEDMEEEQENPVPPEPLELDQATASTIVAGLIADVLSAAADLSTSGEHSGVLLRDLPPVSSDILNQVVTVFRAAPSLVLPISLPGSTLAGATPDDGAAAALALQRLKRELQWQPEEDVVATVKSEQAALALHGAVESKLRRLQAQEEEAGAKRGRSVHVRAALPLEEAPEASITQADVEEQRKDAIEEALAQLQESVAEDVASVHELAEAARALGVVTLPVVAWDPSTHGRTGLDARAVNGLSAALAQFVPQVKSSTASSLASAVRLHCALVSGKSSERQATAQAALLGNVVSDGPLPSTDLFAAACIVTPQLADMLLHSGQVRASKLGPFCPVHLASTGNYLNCVAAAAGVGHGAIPMTAIPDAGGDDASAASRAWLRRALRAPTWIPVLHNSIVYCTSSLPAAVAFARSPESFLQAVPAAPPSHATGQGTVQAAVVGPPCTGKTSVSAALARRTGAVHVTLQGVLHWVLSRPTWSLSAASAALTGAGSVASVAAAVQRCLVGRVASSYLSAAAAAETSSAAVQAGLLRTGQWVGGTTDATAPPKATLMGGTVNDNHLLARAVACFVRSAAAAGRGWVLDGFPTCGADIAMLSEVCGVVVPQVIMLHSNADTALQRAQTRLSREATRLALGVGVAPSQLPPKRAIKVLGSALGDEYDEATERLGQLLTETLLFGDAEEDEGADEDEVADYEADGQRGVELPADEVAPADEEAEEADFEVGWIGVGGIWQPGTGGPPQRSAFAQAAGEAGHVFSLEAAVEAAEALAQAYDAEAEEEADEEAKDATAIAVSAADVALPPWLSMQRRRRGWHTAVTGEAVFVSKSGQPLALPHDTPRGRESSGASNQTSKSAGFFAADGRTLVHGPRSAVSAGGPIPLQQGMMLGTYRRELLNWNNAEAALLHSAQRHFGGVTRIRNSEQQQLSDVCRAVSTVLQSGVQARLVLEHARATKRASCLKGTGTSALHALQRLSSAVSSFCPVSWVEQRRLVDALAGPNPLQFAAEYRGVVFLMASSTCLAKFMAAPTRYLCRASLPPGGDLPVRVPLHAVPEAAVVARADLHAVGGKAELLRGADPVKPQVLAAATEASRLLALGGLCPVSLLHTVQQRQSPTTAKYGLRSMSVLYRGRLFQCSSEHAVRAFMQRPHLFQHLCTPVQSPPPPQLAEHKLPAKHLLQAAAAGKLASGTIGFLSQAVAPLLERALVSMATELPHLKHPKLSKDATAKRYLALFLAAYNPHAKSHVRARGRGALADFLSACKLPLAWKSAAEDAGVKASEAIVQPVPKFFVGQAVQVASAGQLQSAQVIGEPRFMFAQNCYKVRFADGSVDSAVKESALKAVEDGQGTSSFPVHFEEVKVPVPVQLPAPALHRFQVGDLVEALYSGQGAVRYRARITEVSVRSRRATYTVLYADGEQQQLPESALREHSVAGRSPRSGFKPSQSMPTAPSQGVRAGSSSTAAQSLGPPGGESPLAARRSFVRPQASHTTIRMPQKPPATKNWHADPVATPPRAPPGQLLTGASPLPSSALTLAAQHLLPRRGGSGGTSGAEAIAQERKAVAELVLARRVRATDDALDVMGYETDRVLQGQGSDPVAEGSVQF